MSRDDEDDDRPRRRRYDDDEDDYDDRPRRKKGGAAGYSIGLIVGGIVALGLCVILVPVLLLLPAYQKVKGAAAKAQEANNLKQIGLGFHNQHDARGGMFAPFAVDAAGRSAPGNSFRVSLLPYVEQENVYRMFDLSQPWDSPRNSAGAAVLVPTFQSPYDGKPGTTNTPFRVFVGGGAMFTEDGKPARLADVSDGMSNTLLLVHATEQVPWAKPQELPYAPGAPLPRLGHPNAPDGANVLMADGSVRFLKASTPEPVVRALITRAGNERPDPNW